tara:strand:- start:4141 stop:6615 length:2475 start_codon:yes stop_codon:yes gene_type:complete
MKLRDHHAAVCRTDRLRHSGTAVLLLAACLAGVPGGPARAVEPTAMAGPVTEIAQGRVEKTFDIPAQPLAQALIAFKEQSGLQLAYKTEAVAGLATRGVNGAMTQADALIRLLDGTGLVFDFTAVSTVTLARAGKGGDRVTLGTIAVEGRGESAWGPVSGYVARRSATGTKTDTPLIETPQSISVITRDQMAAQGVQNIDQALRYTAGVITETQGADNRFDIVNARGFEADGFLDGMKLRSPSASFGRPQFDPYLLERIEVLRGPSSVIYGQGSPGGVFSMVSKRPTETPIRDVQLQGGSFDNKQGAFDVGGAIDDDKKFLFRLTGLARESGTQVDHTEYERYFIAPSFTWQPSQDTSLTILTNFQADPKAGFFNKLPAKGTAISNEGGSIPTDFYAGDPGFDNFDRTIFSGGYVLEHRLSDQVKVRQNLRYIHMDSAFAAIFAGSSLQSDGHTLGRFTFTSDETTGNLAVDNNIQVEGRTGSVGHTFLAGVEFQWRRWDQFGRSGSGPSIDFYNPVYNQTISAPPTFANQVQTQHQYGLYFQDQLKYGDWSFLLGGRWDKAESLTDDMHANTETEQDDQAFSGRLGLTYQFANGMAPYASYAESFDPNSGTDFFSKPFEPTTGQQYEVGVKYQPPGANMLITASAYQLTQQNVLTDDPDPAHGNKKIATGEIRSRGVEVEGKAELTENLSVLASYAYVRPEIRRSHDGLEGKAPVTIPAHKASLWADYTFGDGPLNGFGIGGGVRYTGASFGNNANTYKIEDVVLLDLSAHYDLGQVRSDLSGLKLAVNATNLLDNEYVGRCQNTGCYYGLRRQVLVTMNYSW